MGAYYCPTMKPRNMGTTSLSLPQTSKHPLMYIRSARTMNKGSSMSGGCTPVNPSPSSSQSIQCDHEESLTLTQAINNLIQGARQRRHRLQQEVSTDLLRQAILCPMSTPLPTISVIVAEGLLVEPQSTFADTVESLSPSATQMGSSLVSDTTSLNRTATSGSTNQSRTPFASTAASTSIRRTDVRRLSGHILSTLLR